MDITEDARRSPGQKEEEDDATTLAKPLIDWRFQAEQQQDCPFSVVARWQQRAKQLGTLASTLQEWCHQEESWEGPGLFPAAHSDPSCCDVCNYVVALKAACQSLGTSKRELSVSKKELAKVEGKRVEMKKALVKAEEKLVESKKGKLVEAEEQLVEAKKELVGAEEELVEAKKELVEAKKALVKVEEELVEAEKNMVMLNGQTSQMDRELVAQLVVAKRCLVSMAANIVDEIIDTIAMQERLVAEKIDKIATLEKLVAEKIKHIATLEMLVAFDFKHIALKEKIVANNTDPIGTLEKIAAEKLVAQSMEPIALKELLVGVQIDYIATKSNHIVTKAMLICKAHSEVKNLLTALSAASNETSVMTTETVGEEQSANILDENRFAEAQSSPTNFEEATSPSVLDLEQWELLEKLEDSQEDVLKPFHTHLQKKFRSAVILDANTKDYSELIQLTVDSIMGWKNNETSDASLPFYLPGCIGRQEPIGVQPILHAIVAKMAQLLGVASHIMLGRRIAGVGNPPHRFVDSVVTNPVEGYLLAILPARLGGPIEVKPMVRKNISVDTALLLEAQNQIIGHLAKRAMDSLHFGGIGEDCEVFGLALNTRSVTAVVLKLSGVGTVDVKVTVQRTERLSLFDEDIVMKLSGANVEDVANPLEDKLGNKGMSMGFSILARTLVSVCKGMDSSLLGHTSHCSLSVGTESVKLDEHLGFGAFSHVFRLENKDNVFVKVPKSYRMINALATEAQALKEMSGNVHIPILVDTADPLKTLSIEIRCETSVLPCLPLRGIIDLSASKLTGWTDGRLKAVVMQVYAALVHANVKGWAHLDVKPSNIIVGACAADCLDGVMPIDWGCAHRTTDTLKGFVGCPPFAHDDLLGLNNDWSPCLDHDLASLAYTVACLKVECIPWVRGFSDPMEVSDDIRNHRLEEASKILKPLLDDLQIPVYIKDSLLNAIGSKRSQSANGNAAPETIHNHDDNGTIMDSTPADMGRRTRKRNLE